MVFSSILQNDGSKPKNFWVKWETKHTLNGGRRLFFVQWLATWHRCGRRIVESLFLSRSSNDFNAGRLSHPDGRHAAYIETDAYLLHMNWTAGVRQRFGQADRGGLRWHGGCWPRRPGTPRDYGRGQIEYLRPELFTSGAPRPQVLSA
jgi:hypothetical protein